MAAPRRRKFVVLLALLVGGTLVVARDSQAAGRPGAIRVRAQTRALTAVAGRLTELAPQLRDPEERSTTYDWAARLLARAGDRDGARDAWQKATSAVTDVAAACPPGGGALLAGQASVQAQLHEPELARQTLAQAQQAVRQCPDDLQKLLGLQAIRSAWHALGEDFEAQATRREIVRLIETSVQPAVRQLQGPGLAPFLGDPDSPDDLRKRLAAIAPGAPDADLRRAELLGRLAALALTAPDPNLSAHLDAAHPIALSLADPIARLATLQALAVAEARRGRLDVAEKLAAALPEAGPLSPDQLRATRAGLLIDLADAAAGRQRAADARRLLDQAEAQLDTVTSPSLRALPLARIARARAQSGDLAAARQSADRNRPGHRYDTLLDLADAQARRGDAAGASALLDAARDDLDYARKHPPEPDPEEIVPDDPALRQRQLANATRAAEARLEAGRGHLDQAEQIAQAIDDPFARQEAVAQLALSRLRAGDVETALTWTDRIPRLDERKDVLVRLAAELSREP